MKQPWVYMCSPSRSPLPPVCCFFIYFFCAFKTYRLKEYTVLKYTDLSLGLPPANPSREKTVLWERD